MPLDPTRQPGARRERSRDKPDLPRRDVRLRPAIEPTFFSRYECKYLVDPMVASEMRNFLRPFTKPDTFAARHPGFRYPICSLYLDSANLGLYQQTVNGEKDRFKLRVRTYSDSPNDPAYFEVKRKINTVVHKRRAGLTRAMAAELLAERPVDLYDLQERVREDVEYFNHHVSLTGARPVVRVKYMREAYQATGNEPVRITFDNDLRHAISLKGGLSHRDGRWTSTPLSGLIVEIKFTERYPWWVQDFVQRFGLKQQAVPKYILSVDHMILSGRESALALAGMTLPPRRS